MGGTDFTDLAGWAEDDIPAALSVFRATAHLLGPEWQITGRIEDCLTPVPVAAHFTGYYEPELTANPVQTIDYHCPIYALPDIAAHPSRQHIDQGALDGRGLEIAWLADPVDRFFLQVQGSGRLRMTDGTTMRVGYAGKNGFPYSSVGKALIAAGVFDAATISGDGVRDWLKANPVAARDLMWTNESFVYFRRLDGVDPDAGPIGTAGVPITAGRSIAVDPDHIPLGALVWIERDGMNRLMVAQDTGSAIKGAGRADIFMGTGDVAGTAAGRINDTGRMFVLRPKGDA